MTQGEISRFSRSILDSAKYTQELLEHDVGVLFQNGTINTLDSDSEFWRAVIIRRIFDLYANQRVGIRTISKILYDEGYASRQGNNFNVLAIRHILCNPKIQRGDNQSTASLTV